MKTVLVNKDGSLSIQEVPKPKYGPKQALTKTIANGICGTDIHLMKKAFKGVTEEMYPLMLGHENVGEVVEVGEEVTGLKVGDKVLLPFVDPDPDHLGPYGSAWGALSEYCVVNDAAAYQEGEVPDLAKAQCIIPDDIDPVDAVMLITLREVLSNVKYFGIEKDKPVVFCGDLNVAHKEIDLKNPKTNRKNAGFTDEERGKFTDLLAAGFVDTFRYFYPDAEGIYSWWSYRFSARAKNVGWRIDYFCVSESLKDRLVGASIHTQVMGSDHCPVELVME